MIDPFVGPALLFCPADRPDRFAKAAAAADVVILDLEDGVAPAHRSGTRQAILDGVGGLDPDRIVVRVNQVGTPAHGEDLALLSAASLRRVMLAKAESRSDLDG